jgi:plastocyanin
VDVHPRSTKRVFALLGLALASAALGACGGDDSATITASVIEEEPKDFPGDIGQGLLEFEADPDGDLAYTFERAVAPPGNTNFVLDNPQSVGHDLSLETAGGRQLTKTDVVSEDTAWVRIPLRVGAEYTFYCSVPGHREAGMEGTIEVESSA